MSAHADEQAMASDFDGFRSDGVGHGENTEFNLKVAGFLDRDWMESRVLEGGGAGGVRHGEIQSANGKNVADASAELAVQVDGRERPARLGEMRAWPVERNLAVFERGKN